MWNVTFDFICWHVFILDAKNVDWLNLFCLGLLQKIPPTACSLDFFKNHVHFKNYFLALAAVLEVSCQTVFVGTVEDTFHWDWGFHDESTKCGWSGLDCLDVTNKPDCDLAETYTSADTSFVYSVEDASTLHAKLYCGKNVQCVPYAVTSLQVLQHSQKLILSLSRLLA